MWECVAFYKVFYIKKKTESRDLNSVFVGYAQNLKVYRLLDLETNVIVEYICIEFIKNKFISDSNVQKPDLKVIIPNSSEKHKNL